MKYTIAFTAAVLSGLTPLAFGQAQRGQDQARPPGAQQEQSDRAAQSGEQEQMGPEHLQKCVKHAASDNQFEIQLGQMVEQRSQNPQVKQLAQKLVQDHQKAQQQLRQTAEQLKIPLSDQLDPVHQAMLQEMQQKQGAEMERAFVFGVVGDHETDVLMAQWQSQHEQNPQIKQYAQQQLPVLEEHLRMARMTAEQFVPQARQAGERMRGNMEKTRDKSTGAEGTGANTGNGRTEGVRDK